MYSRSKNIWTLANPTLIRFSLVYTISLLCACATAPKDDEAPIYDSSQQSSPEDARLDKTKLADSLGVLKDVEDIGFHQVSFNDCSIPRRFRKGSSCSTQYLAVINFRMRCRNSEGTVEQQVSQYELTPLVSNSVKWGVGKLEGNTRTDSRGYGRAIIRSWTPVDSKLFRLTANGQVMAVTAKQVRQFVLPRYWCR